MLTVHIKEDSNPPHFMLQGVIDEKTEFDQLLKDLPLVFELDTRGVRKINSIGIKNWVKFFRKLDQKGIKVIHNPLGVVLVEQLNAIQNFVMGGDLKAVAIPYSCQNCNEYFTEVQTFDQLWRIGVRVPEAPCPRCQGPGNFDDIVEHYFGFLKRIGS